MLPGYIAGRYRKKECFINLRALTDKYQAKLIVGRIIGITDNALLLANGRRIAFDLLSINTGGAPASLFNASNSCTVKPIDEFIQYLETMQIQQTPQIGIIGGGASGVETAFALAERLRHQNPKFHLITDVLLSEFPQSARRRLHRQLFTKGIAITESTAMAYTENALLLTNGERLPMDNVIFATPVKAPTWLKKTGLALTKNGFIRVNHHLQSLNHSNIYAVGDIAAPPSPIPKSGVMAVRQGALLAHNLLVAASLKKAAYKRWQPNKNALYIIGTGDGKAIACRNRLSIGGRWVWRWKHYLDTKFMRQFPTADDY